MREIATALDREAQRERELFDEARSFGPAPGRDRIGPFLEDLQVGPRRSTGRWWIPLCCAAALVLFAWWGRSRLEVPTGGGGTQMLGGTLELLEPVCEGGAIVLLRWKGELPEAGWYELRIWPAAADPLLDDPAVTIRLEEAAWRPEQTQLALLEQPIRWEVRIRTGQRIVERRIAEAAPGE